MTPAELGREAAACADAGASVIHLHVRNDEGSHSLDVNRYRAAMDSVRLSTQGQMLVQVTTEAVGNMAQRGDLGCESPNTLSVLGRYTEGQRSSPADLLPYLHVWDQAHPWSVCPFGPTESVCMTAAMGLGGHVRVGFENNLTRADGATALGNADLVSNVADMARRSGRRLGGLQDALRLYGANVV